MSSDKKISVRPEFAASIDSAMKAAALCSVHLFTGSMECCKGCPYEKEPHHCSAWFLDDVVQLLRIIRTDYIDIES